MFDAIHRGKPTQKLLAYQYLQVLPQIARGDSNKMWIIPSELTDALKGIGSALGRQRAAARGDDDDDWVDPGDAEDDAFEDTMLEDPAKALAEARGQAGRASAEATEHARPLSAGAAADPPRRGCRPPSPARRRPAAGPAAAAPAAAGRARRAPSPRASTGQEPAGRRPRQRRRGRNARATRGTLLGCPRVRSRCPLAIVAGRASAAGTINTIVGSGTLITFPTLLLLRLSRRSSRTSRTTSASCAGGLTGAWGYRTSCAGQAPHAAPARADVVRSAAVARARCCCSCCRPRRSGRSCPVLILIGLVLVVAGPRMQRLRLARRAGRARASARWHEPAMARRGLRGRRLRRLLRRRPGRPAHGAAQRAEREPLQRLNGYKNVLAPVVNVVAAVVFILVARDQIDWLVVLLIGVGAFVGGMLGARVGRRIPPNVLRGLIIVIGLVAIVKLVWFP